MSKTGCSLTPAVHRLEIRDTAVALTDVDPPVSFMSREVIRITPTWVAACGLDPDLQGTRSGAGAEAATDPHAPKDAMKERGLRSS